ncbi:hypothetical protein Patl1_26053 [Pistacia atlantica]|uniref:Uncharacterized protein n=1 Tax=Pistacia atlantica TaxID=434234 RepID=A0ACC1B4G2_9ROSI|nr:hypothetical protein Patl1_26053 [Pistacia atlantica]
MKSLISANVAVDDEAIRLNQAENEEENGSYWDEHNRALKLKMLFLHTPRNLYSGKDNLSRQLAYPTRSIYDAEILGSCNGLVCLEFDYENLFLLNPTRDSRELPKPDSTSTDEDSVFYGPGYNVSINDYKVVKGVISAASNGPNFRDAKVEVLKLKTNTWGRIQYPHSSINIDGLGILLNDTLHWLGT